MLFLPVRQINVGRNEEVLFGFLVVRSRARPNNRRHQEKKKRCQGYCIFPHGNSTSASRRAFGGVPCTDDTLVVMGILLAVFPEADSQSDSNTVQCRRRTLLILGMVPPAARPSDDTHRHAVARSLRTNQGVISRDVCVALQREPQRLDRRARCTSAILRGCVPR